MNTRALLLATIVLAAATTAGAQCDKTTPGVSNAALTVSITIVPGGYQYAYSVTNPASSTGCIYGAFLDVSAPSAPTTLVVDPPLVATPPPTPGSQIKVAPGRYSTPPGAPVNGLVGGRQGAVAAMFNIDVVDGALADTVLAYPGLTVPLFTIVSSHPPVKRRYTLLTVWDPDAPGTPFAVPEDVNVLGEVLGPAPTPVVDADGDGVLDDVDACPATPAGSRIDPTGCSSKELIERACPAPAAKNHGDYVSCVSLEANRQRAAGFISGDEHGKLVSEAAQSAIGK